MFHHYVLCSNELTFNKDTIFFYNSYIINDLNLKDWSLTWFIIGPMVPLVNSRNSIILPIYYYTKVIMACQLTRISSQLRKGRERMTVLVDTSKMLLGERFCRIKLLLEILSLLFPLPKKCFPILPLKGLNQMEYVMQQNSSLNTTRNIVSTFTAHSTQKFHHITI